MPARVAVDRAAEAKAQGVTLFTSGVGNEVDEAALRVIASREWPPGSRIEVAALGSTPVLMYDSRVTEVRPL